MRRSIVVVILLAGLSLGRPAHGAVVCRTKKGVLVIRDTCRKKETGVNLADFGAVGPPGPLLDTLPSGRTQKGTYGVFGVSSGANDFATSSVTFQLPLAFTPTVFIVAGDPPPVECPGTAASPAATAGNLCVYQGAQFADSGISVGDAATQSGSTIRPWGFTVRDSPGGGSGAYGYASWGTWAVTAP